MTPAAELRYAFPQSWLGLLTALESKTNQLQHMEKWLEKATSKRDDVICWSELLDCLMQSKPLKNDCSERLRFLPVLFHLPELWQCHILTFIHSHRAAISRSTLCAFVDLMQRQLGGFEGNPKKFATRDINSENCENVQSSVTSQHSGPCAGHMWMQFWLSKLRASHDLSGGSQTAILGTKTSSYIFSKEHLDWKEQILHQARDEKNEDVPWSFRLCDSSKCITDGGRESGSLNVTFHSEEQIIDLDEPFTLELDTPTVTPQKKRKLDVSVDEDVCSFLSQAVPNIPEQLLTDLQNLKDIWHSGHTQVQQNCVNVFTQCTQDMIENVCEALELSTLTESSLVTVGMEIASLKEKLPLSHVTQLAKHCLLQKVLMLKSRASRHLIQACLCLSEAYPAQVVGSVWLPVLLHSEINNHHCDVIITVMKDALQSAEKLHLIRAYVEEHPKLYAPVLQILQYVIDDKIDLDQNILGHLVVIVKHACRDFVDNKKFGKFVLALIKQLGKQLSSNQVMELEQVASSQEVFLKKLILTALKKLNKT